MGYGVRASARSRSCGSASRTRVPWRHRERSAGDYRGTIQVKDKGGLFRTDKRLYVGSRDCSHLAEGLTWQVEAVTSALLVAGIDPLPSVTPVLCFVDGDWPLLFPPNEYEGVRLEGTRSLRKLISATEVPDLTAIDELTRTLATALPPR